MTKIIDIQLPKDERGNDPNDFRDDLYYMGKLREAEKNICKPDLSWTKAFTLTVKEANMIADPEWVYENLIIRGHLIAIPAPPSAGKTTILSWIAGQISNNYEIFYVNADISGTDAKSAVIEAKEKRFTLLLPDMKAGMSMDDVIERLIAMNEVQDDYSNFVFIFDTLKKMTDVINKTKSKELYKTLRGLTAKGMTIILLAHTNKYNDSDGRPVYEGTGDLRSDVDELIYLVPQKHEDGSMTVSTEPFSSTSKVRGAFQQITFNISPDRKVSQAATFIDVASANKRAAEKENDLPVIGGIEAALDKNMTSQTEICAYCKANHELGRRTVQAVLKRWSNGTDRIWNATKGFQHNRITYSRVLPGEK